MEPHTFLSFAFALWPVYVALIATFVVSRVEKHQRAAANAGNKAYLTSEAFCCGEVQVGNEACPGCPFA